jgi:hypothetical protein
MSWQATSWASKQDCGGVGGKCLLYALANYADMAGRTWAGAKRLIFDTEMSERSIRTWLHELQERGIITVTPRRRANGTRLPDIVILNMGVEAGPQEDYCADAPQVDADQPATVAACTTGNERPSKRQQTTEQPANPASHIENVHLEPSTEPSVVERENARARELLKFKRKYPSAAFDDIAKVDHEWNSLPDGDWPQAVPFIERYLAGLKKIKRSHIPAAWRYLRDRPWNLVQTETAEKDNSTYRSCDAWSKEWWAILFHRADQKKHIDLQVNWARQGKPFGAQRNEWPADELIASLRPFRSIGPEIDAWRPWLEARGAQLPDWRESIWIFLPSPEPPVAGTPALRTTGPPVAA